MLIEPKTYGYSSQSSKKELLEFKDDYPFRKEKVVRNKPLKGVKAFFIEKYDPRMPHPKAAN